MSELDLYVLSAALSANSAATSAAIIANTVTVTDQYRDRAEAAAIDAELYSNAILNNATGFIYTANTGGIAQGISDTISGETFNYVEDGRAYVILNNNGVANTLYEPVTAGTFASTSPGLGRDIVGQPTITELRASSPTSRGVNAVYHTLDGGYYTELASGSSFSDIETANGLKLSMPNSSISRLSSFGFVGNGTTSDTALAQKALDWLARGIRRSLIWDVPLSRINGPLYLPDASRWFIVFQTDVIIEQQVNNTECFIMEPTASRFQFGFVGDIRVWFRWATNQTGSDTKAIGVAFKPTTTLPDGLYHFTFNGLHLENGYDLIGMHPDSASIRCPFWGYRIAQLHFQSAARGRVFNLNSGQPAGAPAGIIDQLYINALSAVGVVFRVLTQTAVTINNAEVNNSRGRSIFIEACQSVRFNNLRFELGQSDGGEDLMVVSGATAYCSIGVLEIQTQSTSATTDTFGITAFGGAVVSVDSAINVRGCTCTDTGRFFVFRSQSGGSPAENGRFCIPPNIDMQITDTRVLLYETSQGPFFTYTSAVAVGPLVRGAVAGVAASTPLISVSAGGVDYVEVISPVDGWVVSMNIRLSAAITAGSLVFRPTINGTAIGAGAVNSTITTGQTGAAYIPFGWQAGAVAQTHRVNRGDRIGMTVTPTGVTGGGNVNASIVIAQSSGMV